MMRYYSFKIFQMVGPKPKPVRPLTAGLEKPSEIKTVGKKKSKKADAKLPSKEPKVGKEVTEVSVKPSESKPKKKSKNADTAKTPVSQETKTESGVEKMPEPVYPEPGKVRHSA